MLYCYLQNMTSFKLLRIPIIFIVPIFHAAVYLHQVNFYPWLWLILCLVHVMMNATWVDSIVVQLTFMRKNRWKNKTKPLLISYGYTEYSARFYFHKDSCTFPSLPSLLPPPSSFHYEKKKIKFMFLYIPIFVIYVCYVIVWCTCWENFSTFDRNFPVLKKCCCNELYIVCQFEWMYWIVKRLGSDSPRSYHFFIVLFWKRFPLRVLNITLIFNFVGKECSSITPGNINKLHSSTINLHSHNLTFIFVWFCFVVFTLTYLSNTIAPSSRRPTYSIITPSSSCSSSVH